MTKYSPLVDIKRHDKIPESCVHEGRYVDMVPVSVGEHLGVDFSISTSQQLVNSLINKHVSGRKGCKWGSTTKQLPAKFIGNSYEIALDGCDRLFG